jgi:hypothetical protein
MEELNKSTHRTESIFLIDKSTLLEEGDTEFIEISETLDQFLHKNSATCFLGTASLSPINTLEIEEFKREIIAQKAEAERQIERQRRMHEEAARELKRTERILARQRERERELWLQKQREEEELFGRNNQH